ncbi:uncharacterized protein DS421_1g29420 [Arachis hypogaea]|nr:uncharacterized protein DS421_1g29420 [Arachis hypogaea]
MKKLIYPLFHTTIYNEINTLKQNNTCTLILSVKHKHKIHEHQNCYLDSEIRPKEKSSKLYGSY